MMLDHSVRWILRRGAILCALAVGAMVFVGCGGEAKTANQAPKMPKAVYEKIFNKEMQTAMSGPGKKSKTVMELVKAEGFTMDDWAEAGKVYGMPGTVGGAKTLTKGKDKPGTVGRR